MVARRTDEDAPLAASSARKSSIQNAVDGKGDGEVGSMEPNPNDDDDDESMKEDRSRLQPRGAGLSRSSGAGAARRSLGVFPTAADDDGSTRVESNENTPASSSFGADSDGRRGSRARSGVRSFVRKKLRAASSLSKDGDGDDSDADVREVGGSSRASAVPSFVRDRICSRSLSKDGGDASGAEDDADGDVREVSRSQRKRDALRSIVRRSLESASSPMHLKSSGTKPRGGGAGTSDGSSSSRRSFADVVVLASTVNRASDALLSAVRTRDVAAACAAESATNVIILPYSIHCFLEWASSYEVLRGVPALCALALILAAFFFTGSFEVFRAMAGIITLQIFKVALRLIDQISARIGDGQTSNKARKVRNALRKEKDRVVNGKDRHRLKYAMAFGVVEAARRRQRDKLRKSMNSNAA